ncbi:mannan endo-1,4-beta-mannosidase A-2 [Saxophila tyrrhenica]|uniref:mannan endo-1,4-beta-mannosidase n=1 Tax=Saxophila tyrrhenica TaxID=1690608 RepID=A0AAV9NU14_9PEZI|nr:mannan endo-1,4-beta-mannosidase A-2 [Saxophila tyrrhenica]
MRLLFNLAALAAVIPFVLGQDDCSVSYVYADVSSSVEAAPSSAAYPAGSSTLATSVKASSSAVVSASSLPAASSASTQPASSYTAAGSYPTTSGTSFVIDGEKSYFAGTNSYWIGFLTNNDDVDTVMQHLKESGLEVLRVWGFNDVNTTQSSGTVYYQSFIGDEPTINTGPDGLQRLDYVVKSAEAHGIKLIINFVNNWTDYGGMAAYFNWAGISSNQEWYNNTKAQGQYQKYIKAVVSRYSDSSAVFAWELANEPRCNGCDTSIMTTWIADTSKYIKSLDSKHMVTTGEEGFGLDTGDDGSYPYTYTEGTDFVANCAVPDIDFCTYHLYPSSWSVSPAQAWGNSWIENHGKACAKLGKPCVLEEFGFETDRCTIESSWEATSLQSAGNAGDMYWQYGDTLSNGQTSDDGFTVYYGSDLFDCLVTVHVEAIDAA